MKMNNTIDTLNKDDILETAKEVFEIEGYSILELAKKLDKTFEETVNTLYDCKGRVIVTGMGKSGLIGKKISATFSSTGTPSYFLHPAESTHGDSGVLTKDDIVLAISNSGETAELLQLLPLVKRLGIKMIAMTGKNSSTLAKKSDLVLDISVEREACPHNLAPTASTTVTLAVGDALAVCLLKKRNFSAEDFFQFHPSGSLGKKLLWKVEDLMKQGVSLPLIRPELQFKEAINIISEKGLGLAVVTNNSGQVEGLLTDGDIRRVVQKHDNIAGLTAGEVMTQNPKSIQKDDLAAKALQIMETHCITSLIILTEDKKLEGIIHIHDLLKAGVA